MLRSSLLAALPVSFFRAFHGGTPILLGLLIANRWGLDALAAYTVAASLLAMAIVTTDWGSSRLLPRELSRRDEAGTRVVHSVTGIRLFLGTGAVIVCVLMALGNPDALTSFLVLAPAVFASIVATNAISARVVERDLAGVIPAVVLGLVPIAVATILWASSPAGAVRIAGAYTIGKWIEAAMLSRRRWGLQRIALTHLRSTFQALIPFGISGVIGVFYSRLPVLALEQFGTRKDLGIVSAATALQNVLLLVPTASALLVYPTLSVALAAGRISTAAAVVRRYFVSSFLVYAAGLTVLALSVDLVASLLSVPRDASRFVVCFVALAGLSIVNLLASTMLQAQGLERAGARVSVIVVTLAIPIQIAFVTLYGAWGALFAVLLTECCGGILLGRRVLKARLLK
jgi:O-antigen/teichoic acid export membrane protein